MKQNELTSEGRTIIQSLVGEKSKQECLISLVTDVSTEIHICSKHLSQEAIFYQLAETIERKRNFPFLFRPNLKKAVAISAKKVMRDLKPRFIHKGFGWSDIKDDVNKLVVKANL